MLNFLDWHSDFIFFSPFFFLILDFLGGVFYFLEDLKSSSAKKTLAMCLLWTCYVLGTTVGDRDPKAPITYLKSVLMEFTS